MTGAPWAAMTGIEDDGRHTRSATRARCWPTLDGPAGASPAASQHASAPVFALWLEELHAMGARRNESLLQVERTTACNKLLLFSNRGGRDLRARIYERQRWK